MNFRSIILSSHHQIHWSPPKTLHHFHQRRQSSSSLSSTTATRTIHPSTTIAATTAATTSLPWSTYFTLRHQRKSFEKTGAISGGIIGFLSGTYYFGAIADFDPTALILGIDPAIAFSIAAIGVSGAGIVLGIISGGAIWRFIKMKNHLVTLVDARDKEFFQRVKRFRSDASKSSPQNQVPDYYGERIKSVAEYRNWLRKQRLFRKKAEIKIPL